MKKLYLHSLPEDWEFIAKVFEALGNPVRQRILLSFEKGEELTIKQLADAFPIGRSTMIFHLKALEEASILVRRRRGRDVWYRIDTTFLIPALQRVLNYAGNEV